MKRAGGAIVVVVVVGNDRCLVEFENLPPPMRTPELPLPTFKPLEAEPSTLAMPLSPVRILSLVPILMPLPPRVTLLPGRLKASTNNGDSVNQRIHAFLIALDLCRTNRSLSRSLFPLLLIANATRRSIRTLPASCYRDSDTALSLKTPAYSSASRRRDAIACTRISAAVTPFHRVPVRL